MNSTFSSLGQWLTSSEAMSAVIGAAITFIIVRYTRKTRLEAEWRIDKLTQYREFLSALSRIVNWRSEDEFDQSMRGLADATNTLSLVAPKYVLDAAANVIAALTRLNRDPSSQADENAKEAIRLLVLAFRRDLDIRPKDSEAAFKFVLQAGQSKHTAR
jgi:hypothetical protein